MWCSPTGRCMSNPVEKIMLDFINGDIDVLVSTTIIETGLDISNANTMIIQDAEPYGSVPALPVKGPCGPFQQDSLCVLMYKRDKVLKEVAEKRL